MPPHRQPIQVVMPNSPSPRPIIGKQNPTDVGVVDRNGHPPLVAKCCCTIPTMLHYEGVTPVCLVTTAATCCCVGLNVTATGLLQLDPLMTNGFRAALGGLSGHLCAALIGAVWNPVPVDVQSTATNPHDFQNPHCLSRGSLDRHRPPDMSTRCCACPMALWQ